MMKMASFVFYAVVKEVPIIKLTSSSKSQERQTEIWEDVGIRSTVISQDTDKLEAILAVQTVPTKMEKDPNVQNRFLSKYIF